MDNRGRIRRVSSVMQLACSAYLLLAPIYQLGLWLNFEYFAPILAQARGLPIQIDYIGPLNLLLGFLVSAIPIGLMMYGVWRLRQLFSGYKIGALFTKANASHLHAFATMLFLSVLTAPIVRGLLSLVLTMNNPPGQRSISLSVGSNDLATVFIAGVLLAIAWILREGHRLATENAEFV